MKKTFITDLLFEIQKSTKIFLFKIDKMTLPFYAVVLVWIVLALVLIIGILLAWMFYRRKVKFFCGVQEKLLSKCKDLEEQLLKISVPSPVTEFEDKIWHEEETNFLFALHAELATTLKKDILATQLAERVHDFWNVQKTILLLIDSGSSELKIAHSLGVEQDIIQATHLKSGEGISGFVVAQARPIMIDDLEQDNYLKKINIEPYLEGNFLSVPIVFQKNVLGVLHVCHKKNNKLFSKRDYSLMVNVGKVGAISLENALLYEEISENYMKTIAALASAIDARDPYTKWHSENVTRYVIAIANEMRLNQQDVEQLRRAALLHDVGKIGIRDNILLKKEKLNNEEFEEIKAHPLKGEEILRSLSFLRQAVLCIRHHHESFDGKGYPDHLRGHDIETGARILAVADTFDAMTTDRPYRKGLPLEEAVAELERKKNIQFDPDVVDVFIKILRQSPGLLYSPRP